MNHDQAKELLPVIQALAEGKEIQFRLKNGNVNRDWIDNRNPVFDEKNLNTWEWRIKPEKTTRWINIYDGSIGFESKAAADASNERTEASTDLVRTACIQITYEEGEGL